MNQACVSLDEVFAAAGVRAASLVPETSGYLALAVADATSRLPYVNDDRAVLLTVDGSVMVPRKGAVAPPPEAGRALRETLRRLLAASTGSMPGLTAAARARSEEIDVDRVVGDIEGALIPVNRAAAKRALARLARETLRAKEAGKLKKKAAAPVTAAASGPAALTRATAAASPAADAPRKQAEKEAPRDVTAKAPVIAKAPGIAAPVVAAKVVEQAKPVIAAPVVAAPVVESAPAVVAAAIIDVGAPEPARLVIAPPAFVAAPVLTPPAPVVVVAAVATAPGIAAPVVAAPVMEEVEVAMAAPTPTPIEVAFSDAPTGDYVEGAAPIVWSEGDATIMDPGAMAVFEAEEERAPEVEAALAMSPTADDLLAEDEEALTKPWQGDAVAVAPIAEAAPAAEAVPAALLGTGAPMGREELPEPTAGAHEVMFSEPGTRADELLDAFGAEDQGERAVQAAASSLRAFAGVDEGAAASEDGARAGHLTPTFMRRPAVSRREAQGDDDELLPLPAPRGKAQDAGRSRWPLAVFALGVLALFAAWLYRPTLAKDFFGLRQLVSPAAAPSAPSPAPAPPEVAPATDALEPAAVQSPARSRDARATTGAPGPQPSPHASPNTRADGSGDGAHRRRD